MRWKDRRTSQNVEDRRSHTAPRLAIGGGLGGLVVLVLALLMGGDLGSLVGEAPAGRTAFASSPAEEELAEFVGVVLADTEDVWNSLLGPRYREPTLVLFRDQVDSACGFTGAAVGPFYCPSDENVYIDLAFFDELRTRFGAPGDFAQAYVIAHEVGHHVQKLLGTMDEVHGRQAAVGETDANRLSVMLELQADFYAGVWAHHAERMQLLERGDVEEALGAASAIGDDRLQRRSQGHVVPETFTHGTSAQRMEWFQRGFQSGDPRQGDTFSGSGD
jgi:predicted metalloprotease